MELSKLKKELSTNDTSKIVNKYILGDVPKCFNGNEDLIFALKESLVNHFDIHFKNIEIVGSAKLGIKLSEGKTGKPYDKESDIDFVLVSSELFDIAWHELLRLEFQYYKLKPAEIAKLKDCYNTICHGFISPDKLPPKTNFYINWWKIFLNLSGQSQYEYRKIRGRLFKNWWFAEKYYSIQLNKLKSEKEATL